MNEDGVCGVEAVSLEKLLGRFLLFGAGDVVRVVPFGVEFLIGAEGAIGRTVPEEGAASRCCFSALSGRERKPKNGSRKNGEGRSFSGTALGL